MIALVRVVAWILLVALAGWVAVSYWRLWAVQRRQEQLERHIDQAMRQSRDIESW